MKHYLFLIVAVVSMTTSAFAQIPGDDNGFGMRFFFEMPAKGYGMPNYQKNAVVEKPNKAGFGFALENRWYFIKNNSFIGMAFDARWFDFSFSRGHGVLDRSRMYGEEVDDAMGDLKELFGGLGHYFDDLANYDAARCNVTSQVLDIALLAPGAVLTLYPFDWLFLDFQYNLSPTFQGSWRYFENPENFAEDCELGAFGFALGHIFGASVRFKRFTLGAEYKMAGIKNYEYWKDGMMLGEDEKNFLSKEKYNGNRLRWFLAVKF